MPARILPPAGMRTGPCPSSVGGAARVPLIVTALVMSRLLGDCETPRISRVAHERAWSSPYLAYPLTMYARCSGCRRPSRELLSDSRTAAPCGVLDQGPPRKPPSTDTSTRVPHG